MSAVTSVNQNPPTCHICCHLYDENEHVPMAIIPCIHTLCQQCVARVRDNKCPDCRVQIEDIRKNFGVSRSITPDVVQGVRNAIDSPVAAANPAEQARTRLNEGESLCEQGHYAEAIESVRGLVMNQNLTDLERDRVNLLIGSANFALKKYVDANLYLGQLACDSPYYTSACLFIGMGLVEGGENEECINYLEVVAENGDEESRLQAYLYLGFAHGANYDWGKSNNYLNAVINDPAAEPEDKARAQAQLRDNSIERIGMNRLLESMRVKES